MPSAVPAEIFEIDRLLADAQRHRAALGRGRERDRDVHRRGGLRLTAGAAPAAVRPAGGAAAAAKDVVEVDAAEAAGSAGTAEDLAEDLLGLLGIDLEAAVAGDAAAPMKPAGAAGAGLRPGEAEAVVLFALGLVAEHVVGVLHFLEVGLGLLVAGIAVGMVFACEVAIRLLDLVGGGVLANTQHFVVIAWHGGLGLARRRRTSPVAPRRRYHIITISGLSSADAFRVRAARSAASAAPLANALASPTALARCRAGLPFGYT